MSCSCPVTAPSEHILTAVDAPSGIPADLRARDGSPTPTSDSASSAATDRKKKHGLTLSNPFRKPAPPAQTPLPPATPTKAAKLLGLEPESPHGVPVPTHHSSGTLDGINEEQPHIKLKQGWPQQHYAPAQTAPNYQSASRVFENIETDDEDEPLKSKGFWGNSKKTAKKMSDQFYRLFNPSQPDIDRISLPPIIDSTPEGLVTNYVYSIGLTDYDRSTHDYYEPLPPPPPRSEPKNVARRQQIPPKTISKHKARKEQMDRMTPVTEASHDNMKAAYREDEEKDDSEMDVIDEYADDNLSSTDFVPPQRSESLMPLAFRGPYELAPGDEDLGQNVAAEKEEWDAVHLGTPVQINKRLPAVVHRQSPLQAVENQFLDAAEKELEAKQHIRTKEDDSPPEHEYFVHGTPVELSKAKLLPDVEGHHLTPFELELQKMRIECDVRDATRIALDKEVDVLKESHVQFKKDFAPYQALVKGSEIVEDDDHISIRSSIDLDEEPTLHVARAITITRVTPGMVKLVDIPPRKNKNVKVSPVYPQSH